MSQEQMMRPLAESDRDLLRTATLTNMNWSGEQRLTYRDMDQAQDIRHYYDIRTDRGDFGFVAEEDGSTVGVVWALFLGPDDPGYGFVADGVPELSITVWSGYRSQGVGRALMRRIMDEARVRGLPRISLSVEQGNPALLLYRSVGFERAPGTHEGTYVVDLTIGHRTAE